MEKQLESLWNDVFQNITESDDEVLSNLSFLLLSCLHFQIYKERALLRMKLKSVPAWSKLSPAHVLNGCSSASRTTLGVWRPLGGEMAAEVATGGGALKAPVLSSLSLSLSLSFSHLEHSLSISPSLPTSLSLSAVQWTTSITGSHAMPSPLWWNKPRETMR